MNGALLVLGGSLAFVGYTYVLYPALLCLLPRRRKRETAPGAGPVRISVVLPAYNEAGAIRETLEAILASDYPAESRQVMVVSDASTDGTDAIVEEFHGRGVQLLRQPRRLGKTAGENAALSLLTGEIVINTDASVRIHPGAISALVRALEDPGIGVASARDISVAPGHSRSGESNYVGYEMWVRGLETAVDGIVGASGCLYAIRKDIHRRPVPGDLSRDFASALTAREMGYRAVSVQDARCFVRPTQSLRDEYRRKVRTIARGLGTLAHKRGLLNPWRYRRFSWMLASHKVCRWLVPWAGLAAAVATGVLALEHEWARVAATAAAGGVLGGVLGWFWPGERPPRVLRALAFGLAGNLAVLHAWIRFATGRKTPFWSPTRRSSLPTPLRAEHDGNRLQHDRKVLQG